jgi:hypothetical protein
MFRNIYATEGLRRINKGVNAVAIRQVTNWGSRFGLSRLAEDRIRRVTGKDDGRKLSPWEKILASLVGGGLSAWNQPIEVIRVEMQSMKKDPSRPADLTIGKRSGIFTRRREFGGCIVERLQGLELGFGSPGTVR